MAEIQSLLSLKGETIDTQQFTNLIRMQLCDLDDLDLDAIITTHIPTSPILNKHQYMHIFALIKRTVMKILPRNSSNAQFSLNSFVKIANGKICTEDVPSLTEIDNNSDFQVILGEQFYEKLMKYGPNGLLFQKMEQQPQRSYSFFHWIQNNIQISINNQDNLYLQLLKRIWLFKFDQALQTLQKIKITFKQDEELPSMQLGISFFRDIYQIIRDNEQLKQVFIDRKDFNIKYQQNYSNNEVKDFNRSITQMKERLNFNANYFSFIRKDIKNQFYYAIAYFLSNREDNYIKYNDQIINIQRISITDRFLYAKRFYRNEDFEAFKNGLIERYASFHQLDYVLLFGTNKISEVILQNYIDETNQIQKAAIVSVYLKNFLEQNKTVGRTTFSSKFKKAYESLIADMDMGISKHKFDKKCITIEVQGKKKAMKCTFQFMCEQCGKQQSLLSITKRIITDSKQAQKRMKGNKVFLKDNRNQVSNCVDCMFLLPRCVICLFPVTVYNGFAQQAKKNNSIDNKVKNGGQSLANALVWCPECFHGGHFAHMMKWMQRSQKKCPVYSCKCKCSL